MRPAPSHWQHAGDGPHRVLPRGDGLLRRLCVCGVEGFRKLVQADTARVVGVHNTGEAHSVRVAVTREVGVTLRQGKSGATRGGAPELVVHVAEGAGEVLDGHVLGSVRVEMGKCLLYRGGRHHHLTEALQRRLGGLFQGGPVQGDVGVRGPALHGASFALPLLGLHARKYDLEAVGELFVVDQTVRVRVHAAHELVDLRRGA